MITNDFYYSPYYPIIYNYDYLKQKLKQYELDYYNNINAQIIEYKKYGFKANKEFQNNYIGKVFQSNYNGPFKVLAYYNYDKILIEFINTGYKTFSRANNIKHGELKDPFNPSVLGVGYLGLGTYGTNDSIFNSIAMFLPSLKGLIRTALFHFESASNRLPAIK